MLHGALAAAISIMASGCATPVKNSGYLADYHSFDTYYDKELRLDLDLDFLTQSPDGGAETGALAPLLFVVDRPVWIVENPWPGKPEKADSISFVLRERMYRYLLREFPHPVRARYALRSDDPLLNNHRVIVLSPKITDTHKGSGLLRYAFGWGTGKAAIQIEGEIFGDIHRTKQIGKFAFRENHGGYSQNGFNPAVIKSDYAMKYAVEQSVREFTEILGDRLLPISGVSTRLEE